MVRTSEGADALANLLTSTLDASLFIDARPETPTAGVGETEDTEKPSANTTFLPGYIGSLSSLGSTLAPGGGATSVVSHTTGASSLTIQTPVVTSDQNVTLAKVGLYGADEKTQNVEPASALWYVGLLSRRMAVTIGDKTQTVFILTF